MPHKGVADTHGLPPRVEKPKSESALRRERALKHMSTLAARKENEEAVVLGLDSGALKLKDGDVAAEDEYCTCGRGEEGDMVACDNLECKKKWFHYECVGLTNKNAPGPEDPWLCPDCVDMEKEEADSKLRDENATVDDEMGEAGEVVKEEDGSSDDEEVEDVDSDDEMDD